MKTDLLQHGLYRLTGLAVLVLCLGGCNDSPEGEQAGGGKDGVTSAGESAGGEFDPVLVNGPIFVEWPQPKLAIVISGRQRGYLEPCGCAGLENLKGGINRRHALMNDLKKRGWPVLAIDSGDQIRRFGRQAEIKFQYTARALKTMGYQAVGLGPSELRLPTDSLLTTVVDPSGDKSRFVSANVGLFGLDSEFVPRWQMIETPGGRIGIASVLGEEHRKSFQNDEMEMVDAAMAARQALEAMGEECECRVLVANATRDESITLAKQFPEFDVVVTSDGPPIPPAEPERVEGQDTLLIDVGHKGEYLIVLGLYDDPNNRWRYQRVPLDTRFGTTVAMTKLMSDYQVELQTLGFDGLGLTPMAHPRSSGPDDPRARFAGAASCRECHPKTYEKWSSTPHSHATERLMKLDPPRQFDPECISCHATGWEPQEHVPYVGGWQSEELTSILAGNGCENCHGPAAAHVEAERARGADRDLGLIEELRASMRLTKATAQDTTCIKCHDEDNSPDFDFNTYWPKIEHPWKD